MNTNINTDNYEAYLLDYLEGNLDPDKAEQIKAFIAAQGLDWDELTEALPHLEAPQITYDGKQSLKKKRAVVPLYVKIASAAAAAGLLLTVGLWPEKSMPKLEPIAELKPIRTTQIEVPVDIPTLHKRPIHVIKTQPIAKGKPIIFERTEMPILAELEPKETPTLPTLSTFDKPDFEFLAYRLNADLAIEHIDNNDVSANYEDESEHSLISRGLLWLTNGRHDSFASLINAGVNQAKQKATEVATDMALTAYHRAEDSFEETWERWEEKRRE